MPPSLIVVVGIYSLDAPLSTNHLHAPTVIYITFLCSNSSINLGIARITSFLLFYMFPTILLRTAFYTTVPCYQREFILWRDLTEPASNAVRLTHLTRVEQSHIIMGAFFADRTYDSNPLQKSSIVKNRHVLLFVVNTLGP